MPVWQVVPGAVQVPPAQHGCSAAPQARQVPLTQISVVPHVPPAQQGWVGRPQGVQVPPTQALPWAQVSPPQHT